MRILTVCTLGFFLSACGGAQVVVLNRSSARLENVVVSAQGDSVTVHGIEASGQHALTICPTGEVGALGLSFKANGHDYQKDVPIYLECNSIYRIKFEVSAGFEITARPETMQERSKQPVGRTPR